MLTINTFPEYQFALKLRLVVFNAAMNQNEKAVEDFRTLNEAMEAYERKIYDAYAPLCVDCDMPPFEEIDEMKLWEIIVEMEHKPYVHS